MASFQAKIVWKRPRKRENKNYRVVTFLHDALQKIPKKQQKNEKNYKKNSIMASVGSQVVAHTLVETGNGPNRPNTIDL